MVVQMTAAEHYALTALLRSSVTQLALNNLGLHGLMERLSQPYKDELMERGLDALAALRPLPGLEAMDGYPINIHVPIEHQHEGLYSAKKPLGWYRWHTDPITTGDLS